MPYTWIKKADFAGGAVAGAVGLSIGGKGYIGTGYDGSVAVDDFWEYDPATNIWTWKADFGGPVRYGAVGFSIGNKGYIGLGTYYDNGPHYLGDLWEYDPAANIWTRKADFGGTPRAGSVGFSIGNKGYVGMGSYDDNGAHYLDDFWEYDPATNIWTQKADFGGEAVDGAAGFSIGNKGYIGTGYNGSGATDDFWEYDPAANIWTRKADFSGGARLGAVSFSISNKGYIGTGFGNSYQNDIWEYDPVINVWTQKSGFGGAARMQSTAFVFGNKVYMGLGKSGDGPDQLFYSDFWEL